LLAYSRHMKLGQVQRVIRPLGQVMTGALSVNVHEGSAIKYPPWPPALTSPRTDIIRSTGAFLYSPLRVSNRPVRSTRCSNTSHTDSGFMGSAIPSGLLEVRAVCPNREVTTTVTNANNKTARAQADRKVLLPSLLQVNANARGQAERHIQVERRHLRKQHRNGPVCPASFRYSHFNAPCDSDDSVLRFRETKIRGSWAALHHLNFIELLYYQSRRECA
jgi:hypothetical protein